MPRVCWMLSRRICTCPSQHHSLGPAALLEGDGRQGRPVCTYESLLCSPCVRLFAKPATQKPALFACHTSA